MAHPPLNDRAQRRAQRRPAFVEGAAGRHRVGPTAQAQAAVLRRDAGKIEIALNVVKMRVGDDGDGEVLRGGHAFTILSDTMPRRAKTLRVSMMSGAQRASAS